MKLQVAFDLSDLDKAIKIAQEISEYVDIFEVGSLLIFKHGDLAIKRFKETFPNVSILADVKIADRGKEAAQLLCSAGADWVTVLAGTSKNIIHSVCTTAHEMGKKVMLDLIDSSSLGQSALEAKSFGVDALLFSKPIDEDAQLTFLDRWEMVKGNTQLPVYLSAPIINDNVDELIVLNPTGLVVGRTITNSQDPLAQIKKIHDLLP